MSAHLQEASASIQERCAQALLHHRAGSLQEADRGYREILAIDSRHADSLHLLGAIAIESRRYGEAAELIGKALEIAPHCVAAHLNLGTALQGLGLSGEAITSYNKALELRPDCAQGHYNLANALLGAGRAAEALAAFNRALQLQPDYLKAYNNLGNALRRLGRLDEAVTTYRRALALKPDAELYNNLANVLNDSGAAGEALALYDLAASLRKPQFDSPLANKALLLMEMGQPEQSLQATSEALAVNPASVHAWHIRSELKKFAAADAEIEVMEALLATAQLNRLSVEDQFRLQFALGKAWLDVGDAGRAFAHLDEANRLKRSTFSYDGEAIGRWIEAIAAAFTPELMQRLAGGGHPSAAPVFVVGMPRSGTTLIEQILASHPAVRGAGELRVLPDLVARISGADPDARALGYAPGFPRRVAELLPAELTRLGREYMERVCAGVADGQRVVDKMPANFLYAGLIHLILPNARIIHCRRDAVDTCLSCYTKTFRGDVEFAYDLRELGLYYRRYEALMAHWRALLPAERFAEVHYEDIVYHLEPQARRLVAFCGLEWNEACLAFHRTRRQIRTASANQVCQPLYHSSVGRWRPYERYLGPLLAALEV